MTRETKQDEKKRSLKLVDKYDNDDFSRFAASDYTDRPFEIGVEDSEQSAYQSNGRDYPGISGGRPDFTGHGPKNYQRSDNRIYEETCETLMRHREVDASHIGVKVEDGVVYLSGKVDSRRTKKLAEAIVEELAGVQDVRNELMIFKGDDIRRGPDASLKKDLGIN